MTTGLGVELLRRLKALAGPCLLIPVDEDDPHKWEKARQMCPELEIGTAIRLTEMHRMVATHRFPELSA